MTEPTQRPSNIAADAMWPTRAASRARTHTVPRVRPGGPEAEHPIVEPPTAEHPIVEPPRPGAGGPRPEHPIVTPPERPDRPEHPIVKPPEAGPKGGRR